MEWYIYLSAFIYGIIIGSFLNVCIYRIPNKTFFKKSRSFCPKCGYTLKWFDLIPIFSYIFLRGKCRKCKEHISLQYPIVETLNGVLYVWVLYELIHNTSMSLPMGIIYLLLTSALIVVSVVDVQTYIILPQLDVFILLLGMATVALNYRQWYTYVIGFFAVSAFLLVLVLLGGMGDGDMKLMAVAGLVLGWKNIILAFLIACVVASVFHLGMMIFKKKGRTLPFGPYLSIGIFISMLYGDKIIWWYINTIIK